MIACNNIAWALLQSAEKLSNDTKLLNNCITPLKLTCIGRRSVLRQASAISVLIKLYAKKCTAIKASAIVDDALKLIGGQKAFNA